ncbi:hypothetical protein F503_07003 [Ophiostoma piceae UAMH 11346]|uniref:Uncharacterized protein n=1 Tax=Ophiostoma piceae (strain UAMH 11346) TaxID=1262450 RepID=S3C8S1_OPHP1|nr:hypothetical protein F503_07003 [Ophiostoma piceae UAMH 11346]
MALAPNNKVTITRLVTHDSPTCSLTSRLDVYMLQLPLTPSLQNLHINIDNVSSAVRVGLYKAPWRRISFWASSPAVRDKAAPPHPSMESDLVANMPVVTVAVQNICYDVPTAHLVRGSPYWQEQLSAHLRQYRALLVFMGGDFDVDKIPAVVLDETRHGLTVTPDDFRAYIELLKDEESAQPSAALASATAPVSDTATATATNTNEILPWWSPPGPPPPIAHTGNVLARMAHYFGRAQLSRDIQKALLQMKQAQYAVRSDAGPDYSPVHEQQLLLQVDVARRRAEQELQRQAREIKDEEEMNIWLYDGGGRSVVSGDDSSDREENTEENAEEHDNGGDSPSGEDGSTACVLPPMLSPLPPHLYRSAASQSQTSSQRAGSGVSGQAMRCRPLPIMEPRIVLSLPSMRLPMSLLSPSSLPSPAVSVLSHSSQELLVRSAHSMVEGIHGRQLVTLRLPAQQQPPQQPHHQLGRSASPSASSSFAASVAQRQAATGQGARPGRIASHPDANTHATVAREARQTRQTRQASGPGRLPRPCRSAGRSGRGTLVVRSRAGNRPRPPSSGRAAVHRRWSPYRYPDPLAGLGYYMRDWHGRPSDLLSRASRTSRAHTGVPSRRPSAANQRRGPPTGQSEGPDDSEQEAA